MSSDPIIQAVKGLVDSLAPGRLRQMEHERGEAGTCDHLISTPWQRRLGFPIFARCRRAAGHPGMHEDEYARRWRPDGLLLSPEE